MKIAHINNRNELQGWYDTEIHTSIPTPNIEVTDDQWQIALDSGHNKINEDGTTERFDFRTEEEITQQQLTNKINEAKAYLVDTDWYYIRKAETGQELPSNVLLNRTNARALINNNKS